MNIVRFYREIYRDNLIRTAGRRNLRSDVSLYLRNRLLQLREAGLQRRYDTGDPKILFIVGAPRSGTTLLYQLLARHLDLGYVNNRMARYWLAPVWAAQRHGDPSRRPAVELKSDFGNAQGGEAPHEFSYFWQFWTGFEQSDDRTDQELDQVDWVAIRRALGGLEGWFGRPLVAKCVTYVTTTFYASRTRSPTLSSSTSAGSLCMSFNRFFRLG